MAGPPPSGAVAGNRARRPRVHRRGLLAQYLTWWYAPAVAVLSHATLLFYGASMLLAAVRGYAGCEVLAVSNTVLRRDDQIGCAPFWPNDAAETRRTPAAPAR